MTRDRSIASLADEAGRRRRELREEQAAHAGTRQRLREANRALLGVYLRNVLADPRDFEVYIGLSMVVDEQGRIVWERVDLLLRELLADRPHLSSVGASQAPGGVPAAVDWAVTGTWPTG